MLCTLKDEVKMNNDLVLRVEAKGNNFFICDSGASSHMTNNDSAMFDIKKVDRKIRVGNGETVKAIKMGKIKTSFKSTNGKILSATLTDVIHVPNLSYNLLSVGKLQSHASVVFNLTGAHMVVKHNKIPFE